MKKKLSIFVLIVLVAVAAYLAYTRMAVNVVEERPSVVQNSGPLSEEDKLDVLKSLSSDGANPSGQADSSTAEKTAILKQLSASSTSSSSASATSSNQAGPSDAEKMRILEALKSN